MNRRRCGYAQRVTDPTKTSWASLSPLVRWSIIVIAALATLAVAYVILTWILIALA